MKYRILHVYHISYIRYTYFISDIAYHGGGFPNRWWDTGFPPMNRETTVGNHGSNKNL